MQLYTASTTSYDILKALLAVTNVGDLNRATIAFENVLSLQQRKEAVIERLNPFLYISKLTPKPNELLQLMRDFKIVLEGLRAADYFYPGVCTDSHTWNFHCPNDITCVTMFIDYMESIECVFSYYPESSALSLDISGGTIENTGIVVLNGTIVSSKRFPTRKVRLYVSDCASMIGDITKYNTNIAQCLMTGFCAISLHHIISKANKAVEWILHEEINQFQPSIPTINIVYSQNTQLISYEEYCHTAPHPISSIRSTPQYKHVDDYYSKIIYYADYDTNIKDISHIIISQSSEGISFINEYYEMPKEEHSVLKKVENQYHSDVNVLIRKLSLNIRLDSITDSKLKDVELNVKKLLQLDRLEFNDRTHWLMENVCADTKWLNVGYLPF